jgi:hypothetical protein
VRIDAIRVIEPIAARIDSRDREHPERSWVYTHCGRFVVTESTDHIYGLLCYAAEQISRRRQEAQRAP